jgi:cytochrome c peroxidase
MPLSNHLYRYIISLMMLLLSNSSYADSSYALGYGKLGYDLPAVGSYQLPALGKAADGKVINEEGKELSLHQIFDGKYVLLSFIYSRCDDVNGCPLTSYVFSQIKSAMKKDPQLARDLKLVSLSFDPEYDTAEVLKLYANNFKYSGNKGEWDFLSTSSVKTLQPILKAYGQEIQQEYSQDSKQQRFSHILRVFLIDPELKIRNIYSVAFLHKDLLLDDVKTLMQQNSDQQVSTEPVKKRYSSIGPGDDKSGYDHSNYQTKARAIALRTGKPLNLKQLAENPPLGLPAVPVPADNPLTRAKIALGRKLFYDRRLSLNNTFSCAMCHIPEQGFTSNELQTAVGIEGRTVRRNSPTILNVAYAKILFHDGREYALEQQIWGPLLTKSEMGNPSVGSVIGKISSLPDYSGLFEKAFAGEKVSMQTLGQAIACYERTLVSADSAFDRWYFSHDKNALSTSAQRGFSLFSGKAGCSSCHQIGKKTALFMDNQLHNTGIGYRQSMGIKPDAVSVQLAPGVFVNVDSSRIESVSGAVASDVGQYEVTEVPAHRWRYKTPTLRNVALSAPYMHNGSISTLSDVVDFYNGGGVNNPLLDKRIKPLHLNQQEKQDLVSFLESLTGSNVTQLVSDAFAAPIGDIAKVEK